MKNHFALSMAVCFVAPVLAASPITYDALLSQSNGDATPRSLMGRSVVVAATKYGELGFTTAKGKELTFLCKSGDKSLTGKKPKPTTFTGTTISAQGWEGATVWSLSDCQPGASAAQELAAASVGTVPGATTIKIKGDADPTGSPPKATQQTIQGVVFSDKDPGGWYFGLKVPGKKSVRLTYSTDAVAKTLVALEDNGQTVVATGFVGTYPGGTVAFDNARDVEVKVLAK